MSSVGLLLAGQYFNRRKTLEAIFYEALLTVPIVVYLTQWDLHALCDGPV